MLLKTGLKGEVLSQTFFVVGMIVLSGIILISSGVLISGLNLPFSTSQPSDSITYHSLRAEINNCMERSSDNPIVECKTDVTPVGEDINQELINDSYDENVNFLSGALINKTQVSLKIIYSKREQTINISKNRVCDPWNGDTCADIPCSCQSKCVYNNPEVDNDKGNILGCYSE